eukprot:2623643-Prymnesium_polylepis.1
MESITSGHGCARCEIVCAVNCGVRLVRASPCQSGACPCCRVPPPLFVEVNVADWGACPVPVRAAACPPAVCVAVNVGRDGGG